jgi:hypothetical protein
MLGTTSERSCVVWLSLASPGMFLSCLGMLVLVCWCLHLCFVSLFVGCVAAPRVLLIREWSACSAVNVCILLSIVEHEFAND